MRIFTDSSFDETKGICGIGLYIEPDNSKPFTLSHYIKSDDNNYGEMHAVYIASILGHGKDCTIYTDSQCAISYIKNQVKEKPRSKEQYERHQRLRLIGYKIRKLNPKVEWCKGHHKVFQHIAIGNQIADSLSKLGRAKFYGR